MEKNYGPVGKKRGIAKVDGDDKAKHHREIAPTVTSIVSSITVSGMAFRALYAYAYEAFQLSQSSFPLGLDLAPKLLEESLIWKNQIKSRQIESSRTSTNQLSYR